MYTLSCDLRHYIFNFFFFYDAALHCWNMPMWICTKTVLYISNSVGFSQPWQPYFVILSSSTALPFLFLSVSLTFTNTYFDIFLYFALTYPPTFLHIADPKVALLTVSDMKHISVPSEVEIDQIFHKHSRKFQTSIDFWLQEKTALRNCL